MARKPQAFGVPVTTLVGYYDPRGLLPSYLYPALHGAYGFGYGDDGERIGAGDCQLQVETREGLLHFRLANHRLNAGVMNKFHVNVPTASEPRGAAVLCAGQVLDQASIPAAGEALSFTVNGRPLE
ncbi:Metalloprotease StcE precursor [compost metagenome]